MRTVNALLPAMALFLVGGCGHDMGSEMGEMGDALAAMRAEADQHHGNMLAAPSLPDIEDEVIRHDAAMDGLMAEMHDAMDMMSRCGGGMVEMSGMMMGMEADMDAYMPSMMAAPTSADAMAIHAVHHEDMGELLAGMDGAMGHMSCH